MDISDDCVVSATRSVAEGRSMIRIMIRIEEIDGVAFQFEAGAVTGWVLMHESNGDADDDSDDVEMYFLGPILRENPHIAFYLETPGPCRLDWSDEDQLFVESEWP